ncbi:MAG: lipopolysaccharide heptosyltransferase I [Desulfuromonadaceae bacterium]|nr:lipopolysaccharide heptosyltransferase I [Desulfuromonadaceae bacterium]
MKILIVKLSALGDVVHALPVLSYIKQVDSEAQIDWLVEDSSAAILEGHPLINQVVRVNTRTWRKLSFGDMLREFWTFIQELRRLRYDYVFDLQGNSKSGMFTLACRAHKKYGFSLAQVREWPNVLATRHRIQLGPEEHHVARRALAVVRAALPYGGEVPLSGPLPVDAELKLLADAGLRKFGLEHSRIIVLHYGTTWQTKLWNLSFWQQLALRLMQCPDTGLVLTWGNDAELKAVKEIQRSTQGQAVIWPRVPLPELVALLARADLVVGCDTGPVHIAAAVGTPTVSMYRATDALRNGPEGTRHIRLQAPMPCVKCLRKQCEYDVQCSTSIRVADVLDAVREILPCTGKGCEAGSVNGAGVCDGSLRIVEE